jgi:cytochrome c553
VSERQTTGHDTIGANDMTRRSRLSIGSMCVCFAMLVLTSWPAHAAGDAAAGRRKARQCQTCHGLDGLSRLPEAPNLAGQPESYLVKALNDFRHGLRKNDMMSIVVKSLSDADVADLAAYYASIEITAKPPR